MHRYANLIRIHHGYAYETAGMISVFFADSQAARGCADKIRKRVGDLHIFGSQLTFVV